MTVRRRLEPPALSHYQPYLHLAHTTRGARRDNEGERLVVSDEDNDYNSDDYRPISPILQ